MQQFLLNPLRGLALGSWLSNVLSLPIYEIDIIVQEYRQMLESSLFDHLIPRL
jgi:hypothetical protein